MNKKAIKTLEFNKLIDEFLENIRTEEGKKLAENLTPSSDPVVIERWQQETDEAVRILENFGEPSIFGVYNFKSDLEHIGKGGSLSTTVLLAIGQLLRSSKEVKDFFVVDEDSFENFPLIIGLVNEISNLNSLERKISKAIIGEDEISDEASRELASIRQRKRRTAEQVRKDLERILQSHSHHLQDAIITMRDDRYVIPIKSQYQQSINGVIHDRSSSGQTVYIEPMSVVKLNNDLRMIEREEEEEIHRILRELSLDCYDEQINILQNQRILTRLDFAFGKGKFSRKMEGTRPKFNEEGFISLKKARHPFIDPKDVVPIDLYLGRDYNTLVITGPNTGGKTVSLKTVGLLSMMAMSGLQIPANPGSEIAIFEEIYTDIGDEQSIEQSLSTFSSHMTNIVSILEKVTDKDLVIFDELGAGTDPVEGAALAMSILTYLLEKDIRTIATTHYSQLKHFALETEGVKNGAVEFNVETLEPTYVLEIGLPGKSNAFEISKKLGLEEHLITQAEEMISQENRDFEELLQNIDTDRRKIDETKRQQVLLEEQIKERSLLLEHEINRNRNLRDQILKEAEEEALAIVEKAKKETEELVKELRYLKTEKGEDLGSRVSEIEEDFQKKEQSLKGKEKELLKPRKTAEKIEKNDIVRILGFGEEGQVLTEPDNKGEVQVQVGILTMNVNVKNLEKIESKEEEQAQTRIRSIIQNKAQQNIEQELDLRGKNVEEGRMELDKYLDDALLLGLKEVGIIHGKGTGALSKGIREFLERDSRVDSFRYGDHTEGGLGISMVILK